MTPEEIVKRLREYDPLDCDELLLDAADLIERQEKALEEAEKALEPFAALRVNRFMTNGLRYDFRVDAAWVRNAQDSLAAIRAERGEKEDG